jgi:hypothetical protein
VLAKILGFQEAAARSGRRDRLHRSVQQLSNSKLTRPRILGAVPSVAEMLVALVVFGFSVVVAKTWSFVFRYDEIKDVAGTLIFFLN